MRTPTGPAAFYVGDNVPQMQSTDDGFVTVGDLGWLDEDGFLFLADRRVDMIVTGAANVYPAEVESALSEHPGIADVVVIGLRDPEWGRRVHAIVQPADTAPLEADEVIAFAKQRLAPYKVPKTVEFVSAGLRNDAMKLNRAALVAERDGPDPDAAAGPDRLSHAAAAPTAPSAGDPRLGWPASGRVEVRCCSSRRRTPRSGPGSTTSRPSTATAGCPSWPAPTWAGWSGTATSPTAPASPTGW